MHATFMVESGQEKGNGVRFRLERQERCKIPVQWRSTPMRGSTDQLL